jgi:GNAT superfamily N-acetyltransferase
LKSTPPFNRALVKNGRVEIGPLAVLPSNQGRGIGKLLLDFAESLAPVSRIEVVSCRTDILPMYEKRGYRTVATVPITDIFPESHLTRLDFEIITMEKKQLSAPR